MCVCVCVWAVDDISVLSVKVHLPRLLILQVNGRACRSAPQSEEMAGWFAVLFWGVILSVLPCVNAQNVSCSVMQLS